MKVFGTIFPFIESPEKNLKMGRLVANYEFLQALLKHGHFDAYHLFCLNTTHQQWTKEKVKEMDLPDSIKARVTLLTYAHLIERIKQENYHVFHLGGWGYFFSDLVYLRNRYAKNKFPITGLIHSLNAQITNVHALKVSWSPLLSYDTIICSSLAGQTAIKNVFSNLSKNLSSAMIPFKNHPRLEMVPLGIADHFFDAIPKTDSRHRLQLLSSGFFFLSMGRFSPTLKMDFYPLLLAFQELINNNNKQNIFLLLCGSGSPSEIKLLETMLRELNLTEQVRIFSNFDSSQKIHLYNAADAFISLSDNVQETFGLAVIEAQARGIPVIVSDWNGYRELVETDYNGYKIPTCWTSELLQEELADIMNFETMQLLMAQSTAVDLKELNTALEKLSGDPALCQRLGENGKKRSFEKYRWSIVIKQYEELWEKLFQESMKDPETGLELNPLRTDYSTVFTHYPTSFLAIDNLLKITARGKTVLSEKKLPPPLHRSVPLSYPGPAL